MLGADNNLYDASGSLVGKLPSYLGNTYFSNFGSTVFSPDGKTLYQIGQGQNGSLHRNGRCTDPESDGRCAGVGNITEFRK